MRLLPLALAPLLTMAWFPAQPLAPNSEPAATMCPLIKDDEGTLTWTGSYSSESESLANELAALVARRPDALTSAGHCSSGNGVWISGRDHDSVKGELTTLRKKFPNTSVALLKVPRSLNEMLTLERQVKTHSALTDQPFSMRLNFESGTIGLNLNSASSGPAKRSSGGTSEELAAQLRKTFPQVLEVRLVDPGHTTGAYDRRSDTSPFFAGGLVLTAGVVPAVSGHASR